MKRSVKKKNISFRTVTQSSHVISVYQWDLKIKLCVWLVYWFLFFTIILHRLPDCWSPCILSVQICVSVLLLQFKYLISPFLSVAPQARLDILKIHSRKMNLTRGINLRKIAELMPGASGAEVKVRSTGHTDDVHVWEWKAIWEAFISSHSDVNFLGWLTVQWGDDFFFFFFFFLLIALNILLSTFSSSSCVPILYSQNLNLDVLIPDVHDLSLI